jgi:hypothetical protein
MGEFVGLGDVLGAAQLLVESREVAKRDPGINMVGKVKADVERNQKESGERALMHAVRGATPVGIGGHSAMFSNGTQPIDDTPHREVGKQPHEGIQQWNTEHTARGKENKVYSKNFYLCALNARLG